MLLEPCEKCGWLGCKYDKCAFEEFKNDPVAHPGHYTKGTIECIDFIRDKRLNFCLGNAVKYIVRCDHKGTKEQDLRKAIKYIEFELEAL